MEVLGEQFQSVFTVFFFFLTKATDFSDVLHKEYYSLSVSTFD